MKTINVNQLSLQINNQTPLFLLDVRELDEYQLCSLPNAHLIPMQSIPQHIDKVPRDIPVVVYCHHGMRSASVIRFMEQQADFQNLINLEGGIHAWAEEIMQQY
jgi:adenylyltransferase/sulfurtransferase